MRSARLASSIALLASIFVRVPAAHAQPAPASTPDPSGPSAAPSAPPPAEPPRDAELAAIRETLARHDAELARLRAEAEAKKAPSSADVASLIRLSGYVQADWQVMRQSSEDEVNPSTGAPLNENRFVLRRGHIRVDGDYGIVLGTLEIDANTVSGPQVRPLDAEASVRWPTNVNPARDRELGGFRPPPTTSPFIMGTLGLMKTPFGFEVVEADNIRPFLERAAILRALFPGEFDLGLRAAGGWRFFNYQLGLMNGHPLGERQYPGRDPNKGKDLVGRVGADGRLSDHVAVQAGVSWLTGTGFHTGTPSTKDTLVWRDTNENGIVEITEIQAIPGAAATPSRDFHRYALGSDVRAFIDVPYIGELVLRGEVVWAQNLDRGIEPADPVAAGRDLREFGWYAGFTQEVTRWAQIGVRYDRYQPDADASTGIAGNLVPKDATFTTLAIMAAARYKKGRLTFQYDHNTNAIGRTDSGFPTTLRDDAFTVRGQVGF